MTRCFIFVTYDIDLKIDKFDKVKADYNRTSLRGPIFFDSPSKKLFSCRYSFQPTPYFATMLLTFGHTLHTVKTHDRLSLEH